MASGAGPSYEGRGRFGPDVLGAPHGFQFLDSVATRNAGESAPGVWPQLRVCGSSQDGHSKAHEEPGEDEPAGSDPARELGRHLDQWPRANAPGRTGTRNLPAAPPGCQRRLGGGIIGFIGITPGGDPSVCTGNQNFDPGPIGLRRR